MNVGIWAKRGDLKASIGRNGWGLGSPPPPAPSPPTGGRGEDPGERREAEARMRDVSCVLRDRHFEGAQGLFADELHHPALEGDERLRREHLDRPGPRERHLDLLAA